MDDGLAQVQAQAGPFSLPAWKTVLSVTSAVLVAALFLIAGIWKITEPFDAATRMVNAKVPASLGLPAAIGFGIAETFGAVLLLIPRFRRWGAWVTGVAAHRVYGVCRLLLQCLTRRGVQLLSVAEARSRSRILHRGCGDARPGDYCRCAGLVLLRASEPPPSSWAR